MPISRTTITKPTLASEGAVVMLGDVDEL